MTAMIAHSHSICMQFNLSILHDFLITQKIRYLTIAEIFEF